MSVCLPACLLPACESICLHVCLSVCVRISPADAGVQAASGELVSQDGIQLLVAAQALLQLALNVVGALTQHKQAQEQTNRLLRMCMTVWVRCGPT